MSVFVLATGTLQRPPELKTSKAGKPYATATIKVAADNTVDFWSILAFSESAQAELMRLDEGDRLAAQGSLKVEPYAARDGQLRINRTVFADQVVALRQPPRERKAKAAPERAASSAPSAPSAPRRPEFDDEVPF